MKSESKTIKHFVVKAFLKWNYLLCIVLCIFLVMYFMAAIHSMTIPFYQNYKTLQALNVYIACPQKYNLMTHCICDHISENPHSLHKHVY